VKLDAAADTAIISHLAAGTSMVAAAASQLGLFTPTPPGCGAAMTHGVLESE